MRKIERIYLERIPEYRQCLLKATVLTLLFTGGIVV